MVQLDIPWLGIRFAKLERLKTPESVSICYQIPSLLKCKIDDLISTLDGANKIWYILNFGQNDGQIRPSPRTEGAGDPIVKSRLSEDLAPTKSRRASTTRKGLDPTHRCR